MKDKNTLNTELLTKFLAGKAKKHEKAMVQEWLEEDPLNKVELEEYRLIWESSEQGSFKNIGVPEVDWAVLQNRLEDDSLSLVTKSVNRSSWLSLYNPLIPTLLQVAALFLIAAFIGVLAVDRFYVEPVEIVEPIYNEITMDYGHRGGVTLSDGTKVFINSGSRILIPNKFKDNVREVILEGEAYFDVVKNPNKPFIIKTNGSVVEVLGTSFTVRSYPGDQHVQTVVEEGTVSFRANGDNNKQGVILSAGHLGVLNLTDNTMQKKTGVDVSFYLSWKDGYLKFNDESMIEVAKQLERKYDLNVVFEDKSIRNLNLTAELKSRSLKYVLQTIATSLDIDYTFELGKVTFKEKDS